MRRIRKIIKGISVAAMIAVSIVPILTIVFFLRGRKRDMFLDIIHEWVTDLMGELN